MTNRLISAALLGLCLLLPACSLLGLGDGASSEMETHRKMWKKQQQTSYQFTLSRYCFCALGGDFRVTVENGILTSARALDTDEPVSPENLRHLQTIDDLFEIIEGALKEADVLDVTYHPDMGYPTRIEIDYSEEALDDEVMYQAKNLAS